MHNYNSTPTISTHAQISSLVTAQIEIQIATLHRILFTVYAEMLQKMENCLNFFKKIQNTTINVSKSFLIFTNFLVILKNHENRKKISKVVQINEIGQNDSQCPCLSPT